MPSVRRPEPVTMARMPEPTVRYRSRSTATPVEAASDQPETRGVASGVLVRQLPHGDTSLGSWGPRIADEDLDLVIRRLSPVRGQRPTRGLRIEGRQQSLAEHSQQPLTENVAPPASRATPAPSAPANATAATLTPAPQTSRPSSFSRDDRQPACPDVRSSRTREDRPAAQSLAPRSARGESVEIAESSKRSDPVQAANDGVNKQIEALCIMLSRYAAAKGFANQMAEEVKAANTDARHARRAEKEARTAKEAAEEARKVARDRDKVAEERAKEAEGRQQFAEDLVQKADQAVEEAETSKAELEEALHKAEQELASARVEHERYVRVALPAALEEIRAQAVADFLGSEDFNERVAQMYREGMRDMKAGFTTVNPSLVEVDWSFVPAESEETVTEEPPKEGEVTGIVRELWDVIILDDQVIEPEQPAPTESVQAAATAEPEPDQSATVVSAHQEQSEPPAT
ncbi:hypothetical protein TIFTF001_036587 [Ficus carica]|uniref:Uncharacterized protein n=1 Tax=Ficus carica TaxID=3494 RepID=A0AA88JAY6_FICCA|nr:hypothetical protein TIFTF001_036587 [Ficus carica]